MTDEPIPPDEVLPCGCILRCSLIGGHKTLTLIPCRKGCSVVTDTLQEAHAQHKIVEVRHAP